MNSGRKKRSGADECSSRASKVLRSSPEDESEIICLDISSSPERSPAPPKRSLPPAKLAPEKTTSAPATKAIQNKKAPPRGRGKPAPVIPKGPPVQTSLKDFFKSSNPVAKSNSTAAAFAEEDRIAKLPPPLRKRNTHGKPTSTSKSTTQVVENRLTKLTVKTEVVQTSSAFEIKTEVREESDVVTSVEEALDLIAASSQPLEDVSRNDEDDIKPSVFKAEFPGEDDDSSGDEFLSNIPDDMLSLDGPSTSTFSLPPAVLQHKTDVRNPPRTMGQFRNKSGRQCPFYKIMPSTPFTVDAFNFGYVPNCTAYFLSHFHSDHYGGMTKEFAKPIYCSRITANLIREKIGVDSYWINEITMNQPTIIDGTELTLLDANHCPGSVLFLFRFKDGRAYLHTGDFRADPSVLGNDPILLGLREISKLYLDTTYLDPYYEFESQEATVDIAAEFAQQMVRKNPKTLICCGTYSVGKEKIFMRIAKVLNSKVAITAYKARLLKCFEWKEFDDLLTSDWNAAQVHVLPMQALNFPSLHEHLEKFKNFDSILAVTPSGWQFDRKNLSLKNIKPKVQGAVTMIGIPYSEHSSFRELEWFVRFIRPKEVIPTVNVGNPKRRKEMEKIIKSWLDPNYKAPVVKKQNLITGFLNQS